MTGYGKASGEYKAKTIAVDIKSLNGKSSDVRVKCPNNYRDKEIEMRNLVMEGAKRGKLEVTINVNSESGEDEYGLNVPLFKTYYQELSQVRKELGVTSTNDDLTAAIIRIPNVVTTLDTDIEEEEWEVLTTTIKEAVDNLNNFRKVEGKAMEKDLKENIHFIMKKLEEVKPHEEARIGRLKTRLKKNLEDFLGSENVDHNRFEQEVIFYMEKLDINEEKVRLSQHCKYFLEELGSDEIAVGKKLSFISQEIGREINTLGAKAQNSDIQQIVVKMKDALEQIKEQLANVV